jgi:hypothetical protein
VVSGAALDSPLLEELASEGAALDEDVEASEPDEGELVVEDSVPLRLAVGASLVALEAPAASAAFLAAACLAAVCLVAACLTAASRAARAFAAARFSAAVAVVLAVGVAAFDVVPAAFAERAGSWPEASCTYIARKAALNSAAARAATERRIRCTRRLSASRRPRASARTSRRSLDGRGCRSSNCGSGASIVTPIRLADCQ